MARTWLGLVLLATSAACGGGGPLEEEPASGTTSGDFQIDVTDEVAFLSLQGSDVRTSYLVRFRLSEPTGNPVLGLGPESFAFTKDGIPSTSENLELPTNSLAKVDVALCLDNSLSIAVDASGQATPKNVEDLEEAAVLFIDEIVDDAETLRIYKFSTASRTERIGEYLSDGAAWTSVGPGRATTPQDDVRAHVDPGPHDTGTALYQAIDLALAEDPELDDFVVVFSDGVEEGSAPGSKDSALARIEENRVVAFSIGVGSAKKSSDFTDISRFGKVFVSDTFEGVQASFEAVANEVQSVYTVLFDAPDQEGVHEIELTIRRGDELGRFTSSFRAGIDLALGSVFAPLSPGSVVGYTDCVGLWSKGTLTDTCVGADDLVVAGLDEARVSEDGVLHFAVTTAAGTRMVAPFGRGAIIDIDGGPRRTLVPAKLAIGTTWRETPESALERRVVGIQDLEVQGIDYTGCFVVSVVDVATGDDVGTEWYLEGVGLVRSEDFGEGLTTELSGFPSVSASF